VEQGLDAANAALAVLGAGPNAGFERPEADLAILLVTDETDQSTNMTVGAFDTWLSSYKAPPAAVSFHAIASPAVSCGPEWGSSGQALLDLAGLYGGTQVSICDGDWAPELDAMADDITPSPSNVYVLADLLDPATLFVQVTEPDGAVIHPVHGVD
jgi:hypothetical protein